VNQARGEPGFGPIKPEWSFDQAQPKDLPIHLGSCIAPFIDEFQMRE